MHTGVHAAEISTKFAYGDPRMHNEIVRIWGVTYASCGVTFCINVQIDCQDVATLQHIVF